MKNFGRTNVSLRRGFKSEANCYARDLRAELGLAQHAPLSPWKLAEHLEIPLMPLSELAKVEPAAVRHLMHTQSEIFSAATLFSGYRRLILYNDAHHPRRQAADLAHELAHGLLGHRPSVVFDDRGCRQFNRVHEEEANWLGPALLISEEAALFIVEQDIPLVDAVSHYGASKDVITMRIGVTGARRRAQRRLLYAIK